MKKEKVTKLWNKLRDIPVDKDDCIEKKFKHFSIGTNKFEIWHWFEEEFNIRVYDLMYPKSSKIIKA